MGGRGSGGHNRKPVARKKLEGNAGHRRLKKEPPAPIGEPKIPSYLGVPARREWKRVVALLLPTKTLSLIDADALGAYATSLAHLARIEKAIAKLRSPWLDDRIKLMRLRAELIRQLRGYQADFGLTPSSRAKLEVPDNDPTQDPLDDLFSGKDSSEVVQ